MSLCELMDADEHQWNISGRTNCKLTYSKGTTHTHIDKSRAYVNGSLLPMFQFSFLPILTLEVHLGFIRSSAASSLSPFIFLLSSCSFTLCFPTTTSHFLCSLPPSSCLLLTPLFLPLLPATLLHPSLHITCSPFPTYLPWRISAFHPSSLFSLSASSPFQLSLSPSFPPFLSLFPSIHPRLSTHPLFPCPHSFLSPTCPSIYQLLPHPFLFLLSLNPPVLLSLLLLHPSFHKQASL